MRRCRCSAFELIATDQLTHQHTGWDFTLSISMPAAARHGRYGVTGCLTTTYLLLRNRVAFLYPDDNRTRLRAAGGHGGPHLPP